MAVPKSWLCAAGFHRFKLVGIDAFGKMWYECRRPGCVAR